MDLRQKLENDYSFVPDLEIGDGWLDLIDKLCYDLVNLPVPEDFRVIQVKEKFGGLRFYCNFYPEGVNKLVSEAENKSYKICERCGSANEVKQEGSWIKTLCKNCREL